jgi:hypothetical protein
MAMELVEHWFNRRWRAGRRDVYLTCDERGWHVHARRGGPGGVEVVHHFTDQADACCACSKLRRRNPTGQRCHARRADTVIGRQSRSCWCSVLAI